MFNSYENILKKKVNFQLDGQDLPQVEGVDPYSLGIEGAEASAVDGASAGIDGASIGASAGAAGAKTLADLFKNQIAIEESAKNRKLSGTNAALSLQSQGQQGGQNQLQRALASLMANTRRS